MGRLHCQHPKHTVTRTAIIFPISFSVIIDIQLHTFMLQNYFTTVLCLQVRKMEENYQGI